MPYTHQSVFPVRFYECDAYGHLNNAVYLRYMQEAAFNASAAIGFDEQRYAEMGRAWLARLNEIEYLRPVRYGDKVGVTTWVEDMHRVRSWRAYEMRNLESGELVARGWTDWVFVDTSSGKPASIPAEIAAEYHPQAGEAALQKRRRFAEPPPPGESAFTNRRRVEWQDLDPAQHVNNAMYLSYLVETAWRFGEVVNWGWERISADGFGVVARSHQIEYRQPAVYGDELEITTWLSGVRRSTINRHYAIHRPVDGALIAQANSLYVAIDLATGSARRIPADFLADIRPYIVDSID
jgi:acyl-CoA thioester hydrolase